MLVLTRDQILCVVLIQDQTLSAHIDQDGLLWLLNGKESTCNAGALGDVDSIPGSGRSPGGGKGNSLQYCCLGNPIDRGAWWATVHGVIQPEYWSQLPFPPPDKQYWVGQKDHSDFSFKKI